VGWDGWLLVWGGEGGRVAVGANPIHRSIVLQSGGGRVAGRGGGRESRSGLMGVRVTG